MYTDSEGIVLRQTKTLNGRRMVVILSEKFGKVSAGTSLSERGKGRSSLATHPPAHGRYEFYKNRDSFSLNAAETVESFYRIGEDVDKYMAASYALELTDRLLEEQLPAESIYGLLLEFLRHIEKRKSKYGTPLLAYELKLFDLLGLQPDLTLPEGEGGSEGEKLWFDIRNAQIVKEKEAGESLIFPIDFGIVKVMRYMLSTPFSGLEGIALDKPHFSALNGILTAYGREHFELGELKSGEFLSE